MARIRSIKPEFWDSPSTANASPWARLLFIAMWNWADDYGRGTANIKELEGFAFPNDDTFTDRHGNTVQFRALVAEVAECFGVLFYEADNRPYYAIPTWEEHQRNERRAKQSKYPDPPTSPQASTTNGNMHGISATEERKVTEAPRSSGTGTGEQRNRGTEEQTSSSEVATAPIRPEIEALCTLLADLVEQNGSKRPTITQKWRDAARLMLDRDGRTPEQIAYLIRWAQADEFWRSNIQSMPKLRDKFDQLRLKAQQPDRTQRRGVGLQSSMEGLAFFQPQENQ
ncbi:hypothetical protein [Brachybacterium sp. AOP3-A1-3]|uniref:hypothetical protein n=1 Tax=Brachybacterium sp. AOP3-A1-3 TaxID=3457699 RepID=UPI004033D11D